MKLYTQNSLIKILNVTFTILFFFLIFSLSMQVEGSRLLKENSTNKQYSFSSVSSFKNFIVSQAYSGPSRRGRGH
ncbi:hypothetical protein CsatB_005267 [Cannabis sativa]|uniref:Transmembrane protein n=1 Tax=Cannabis sativa TaxID=3483 RepID=A0A803NNN9_CANSA